MNTPTFRCPICNHDLGTSANAYMYGSLLKICPNCKQSYIDRRYHEIAVEGIRPEDQNPMPTSKSEKRKSGWGSIWIGIGAMVLFILIIFIGWIVFPLPIISVICIINGVKAMKFNPAEEIAKKQKQMELERQQSELRMKNPEYVKQLVAIGYIPATYNTPLPQQTVCSNCRTVLDAADKFCPTCGTKH